MVKKLLSIILSICLILSLSGCFLSEVSLFYNDSAEKDGFDIAINKTANCCFVGSYNCTEYTENSEITIPDDYNGIPIKRIGGYFGRGVPSPFYISLAELYMNTPDDSEYDGIYCGDINEFEISEEYTIKDVIFNLYIGKYIEVIEYVTMDKYYPHINEDGSITFYHSVVNVKCSDENKHFYSKDGKLYYKETDKLISDFAYAEP